MLSLKILDAANRKGLKGVSVKVISGNKEIGSGVTAPEGTCHFGIDFELPIRVLIEKGGTRTTPHINYQFDVTAQDLQAEYTVGLDLTDKNQHVLIKPEKKSNEPVIDPSTPLRIQQPPKPGKIIQAENENPPPMTRDKEGNPAHPSNAAQPEPKEVNQEDPEPRSGDAPTATPGTQESESK